MTNSRLPEGGRQGQAQREKTATTSGQGECDRKPKMLGRGHGENETEKGKGWEADVFKNAIDFRYRPKHQARRLPFGAGKGGSTNENEFLENQALKKGQWGVTTRPSSSFRAKAAQQPFCCVLINPLGIPPSWPGESPLRNSAIGSKC